MAKYIGEMRLITRAHQGADFCKLPNGSIRIRRDWFDAWLEGWVPMPDRDPSGGRPLRPWLPKNLTVSGGWAR